MKKIILLTGTFLILFTQFVFSQSSSENEYDVKQYILDLQISNTSTLISGNVTINASVTAASLDTFVIELIDTLVANRAYMIVDSVFVNGVSNTYHHHNDLISIPLATSIPQNQLFSVQIYYHGNANGNYNPTNYNECGVFTTTYSGNTQSFSLGEPYGAKIWFPVKQVLTDKADSVTFYITTDSSNQTGSNGLLESKTILPNGKCKFKWVTHYPIAYYLISFVVGSPYDDKTYYTLLPNQDSVLMENFLIHDSVYYPIHMVALEKANKLMYLYSEKYGIYPFKNEKFGYCVIGNMGEGMEHQTLCTMGPDILDTTMSSIPFGCYCFGTAHEFAHHWFGDYVTLASWNDIWLNEGMASYVEYVALQNIENQASADIWMNSYHTLVKSSPTGSVYVPDSLLNLQRIFDTRLTYGKGASVMHMLRYEINNDSVFFLALRNYLSTYAYSTATTDDLRQVVSTTTGTDFTGFFNQWIYGQGYPIYNIDWYQSNDTLIIKSNQSTSTSITPLFTMHFDLQINSSVGDTIIRLFQNSNNETYKIYFPNTVSSLKVDPNSWLIIGNTVITGITEYNKPFSFNIMPNPANNIMTIECSQSAVIEITNIQGQLIKILTTTGNKTNIDVSSFPSGVYIVEMKTEKGIEVKKFLKE